LPVPEVGPSLVCKLLDHESGFTCAKGVVILKNQYI